MVNFAHLRAATMARRPREGVVRGAAAPLSGALRTSWLPSVRLTIEVPGCDGLKPGGHRIPHKSHDGEASSVDAQHVEGRLLAAAAHRDGSRLHDQRGVAGDAIALGR